MTEDGLPLAELLAKSGNQDALRVVAKSVVRPIMEADVEGVIGAGRWKRSTDRATWRNNHRERTLETRLGTLNLKIPKLRTGSSRACLGAPDGGEGLGVGDPRQAWIAGVPTRRVDEQVAGHGPVGDQHVERQQARAEDIDGRVSAFLRRPLDGERPRFWLDATHLKLGKGGRIVSVAAMVAVAVTTEGRREVVGLHLGPSEAEPFLDHLASRDLAKRGLSGVKLVIGDAHEGLKAAITRVVGAPWQRCRVGLLKNPA